MDAFLARLAQVIVEERLLPRRSSILLAVSGGLDSMTLLMALEQLRSRFGWRLAVAHYNHHLRGRSAAADQRFVERQCKSMELPCHVGHWDPTAKIAAIKKHGVERAAREARLGFLNQTANRLRVRRVVMAHHADDQVELFFVRLLRGAGSKGLGGMRALSSLPLLKRSLVVRPFLQFTRSELMSWAANNGVRFRNDATNTNRRFLRNRVRHEFLPFLEQHFPTATREGFLRTMQILTDESDWLRQQARQQLVRTSKSSVDFEKLHPALQRQTLVLQLEKMDLNFDAGLVERLRRAPKVQVNAPGNRFVSRDRHGRINVSRSNKTHHSRLVRTISLKSNHGKSVVDHVSFDWSKVRVKQPLDFGPGWEFFDADSIGSRAVIRHWKPGDRFQPIGMPRSAKLQDLFTNAKIPREDRHHRLLATAADGKIFWVEGLRIGERFKVTSQTKKCLVWRWHRTPKNDR